MFKGMIFQDVLYGLRKSLGKYVGFMIFMFAIVLGKCFLLKQGQYGEFGLFGILGCDILRGIPTYIPTGDNQIIVPAYWIIMLLFIPFIIGDYCEEDMKGVGLYKIVLSGRKKWWFSKIIWILVSCIVYLVIFYGTQFALTTLFNNGITIADDEAWLHLFGYSDMLTDKKLFYGYMIVVPSLCIFTMFLWSSILGMIIGSVNAFTIISIYVILGMFYTSPYFIGNQLMLLRSTYFDPQGIDIMDSVFIDLILIFGGFLVGNSYIQNKNLI